MEILNKITNLKAELDSLRPFDKDREAAVMQKLRLDWNYHSNHLEGNSLTFGETKALILFGITAAGKPLKDHFEMTGHDEAIKWVEEVVKGDRPLTESFIRELHKLILKESYEMPTVTPGGLPGKRIIHVGVYKSVPNHVLTPTGEIFRFATPEETPAMMTDLIDWYRQKKSDPDTHPLLLASEFHYKFIRIHPFDDGNGRTARILMNFILMEYGYQPVIIKTEDKANYIAALRQSDVGIIAPFIEYIGRNLERSLDIMIRGAKGESIDEPDDVDKEIALIENKLKNLVGDIKIKKSEDSLNSVFLNSIKPLFNKYQSESLKFKHLYSKSRMSIFIEYPSEIYSKKDKNVWLESMEGVEDHIKSSLEKINLSFSCENFNKTGIIEFSHNGFLTIAFREYDFRIDLFSYPNTRWSKTYAYSDELSDDEIATIVRTETKAHTDFINQQIELAQKNKAE